MFFPTLSEAVLFTRTYRIPACPDPLHRLTGPVHGYASHLVLQMNGADPYSALEHQGHQAASGNASTYQTAASPAPVAATASTASGPRSVTGTSGHVGGFPILDKHTKPLVGSDTAKAVRISMWLHFVRAGLVLLIRSSIFDRNRLVWSIPTRRDDTLKHKMTHRHTSIDRSQRFLLG